MERDTSRENTSGTLSRTHRSLVRFPSTENSYSTALPLSLSSTSEIPLGCYLSNFEITGIALSARGSKSSKSITAEHSDINLEKVIAPKKKTLLITTSEPPVLGQGEDYFLSLFSASKKLIIHSFATRKTWKHFSMILEEVGPSRSSAFGDIKIIEVNDLFVKLINSSPNQELEIGNHILQQNINGKPDSLYHFPPNITLQANSTVTVWTAASEGKHQPPSDFLWKEKEKFKTSPNSTTILCKPNGDAIAWCTPIHWKQAWEKLETDIEFQRCSVVNAASQKHMFHWPKATTTSKETLDQLYTDIENYQMEQIPVFLKREKKIPPTLVMSRSPWCHSPDTSAHPYCPLIEPQDVSGSSLNDLPKSQSARTHADMEAQESIKFGKKMCSTVLFSAGRIIKTHHI
ncbi:lamin tail domain-containing protein 1 [Pipistrellus kuhlii]|uniref:lamin tail domain-containing protein 1 n=1 Tax=Pipistrellus kuhlii TaxID=59472 RepID=UPI00174F011C|nr:lamin tail domain-containing protein 1 [Pipistrellus kuhlii]